MNTHIVVSGGATGRRRVVALVIVTIVAVASTVIGVRYGPQIRSYLTRTKGSPTRTTAYVPFAATHRPLSRLAVVGDSGDSGDRADATGAAIAAAAGDDAYDVLLLLGDAVYPWGDASRVDETVFRPFAPVLRSGTDLFAVLGNHDVARGEGDEELAVMGVPRRWWTAARPGVFLVGLDSTDADDPTQRRWLERVLSSDAARRARWRIAALHHPPYSAGYQGSSELARRVFSPLFERYDVQLVLSGHDHDYQRSVPIRGVTYVVTGGGSVTRRTGEAWFTAVSFSWHHFVDVAVFDDRLVVRAVNQKLRVADRFVLR